MFVLFNVTAFNISDQKITATLPLEACVGLLTPPKTSTAPQYSPALRSTPVRAPTRGPPSANCPPPCPPAPYPPWGAGEPTRGVGRTQRWPSVAAMLPA